MKKKPVKKTSKTFVPNAVLFKLDDGVPVVTKRMNGEWEWDMAYKFNKDQWPDLSAANPFEFVFIHWDSEKKTIETEHSKTICPNVSFVKLFDSKLLPGIIEDDFQRRYNK